MDKYGIHDLHTDNRFWRRSVEGERKYLFLVRSLFWAVSDDAVFLRSILRLLSEEEGRTGVERFGDSVGVDQFPIVMAREGKRTVGMWHVASRGHVSEKGGIRMGKREREREVGEGNVAWLFLTRLR